MLVFALLTILVSLTPVQYSGNPIGSHSYHIALNSVTPRPHLSKANPPRLLLPVVGQSGSPSAVWDEQEGLTFTQNSTSLSYNVTAVSQQDQYGYGPAYLLNGLSNNQYWYQVGFSWDWPYAGGGHVSGFSFNYEVFNSSGDSIDPIGGGGLLSFSGPVRAGDSVLLSLSFDAGNVSMYSYDWNTKASANQSYSAEGATTFVGLSSPSNSNGFFSGLMTEEYYANQYFGSQLQVKYSESVSPLISGIMWIDEYDPSNSTLVFDASSPLLFYANQTQLQSFSSNNATESSDAFEFLTGLPAQVPITLSYNLIGGGTGYSAPTLKYYLDGVVRNVSLTVNPTVYNVDYGSTWSVTQVLGGSSNSSRWATDQRTSGIALAASLLNINYYQQFLVLFNYTILGGGSGYLPPNVNYSSFGAQGSATTSTAVWVDGGSLASYPETLSGSSGSFRWAAKKSSILVASSSVAAIYNYQFNLQIESQFGNATGAGWYDANSGANFSISPISPCGSDCRRVFSGWNGSGTGSYTGENSLSQIIVGSPIVERAIWQAEYYVNFTASPSNASLTLTSGQWVASGGSISISSNANPGWQLEGWKGSGSGSYSGNSDSFTLTVNSPINETAEFYVGVSISDVGDGTVTYVDGAISGTLAPGSSDTIYVPAGSLLVLSQSSSLFYSNGGWEGATNSGNASLTLAPSQPITVRSIFVYNYLETVIIALVIATVILTSIYIATRRRKNFGGSITSNFSN